MTEPESAVPLYDLRVVVERIEGRSACGMRVERTGRTSVARADVR
jgi:hypothetical protein